MYSEFTSRKFDASQNSAFSSASVPKTDEAGGSVWQIQQFGTLVIGKNDVSIFNLYQTRDCPPKYELNKAAIYKERAAKIEEYSQDPGFVAFCQRLYLNYSDQSPVEMLNTSRSFEEPEGVRNLLVQKKQTETELAAIEDFLYTNGIEIPDELDDALKIILEGTEDIDDIYGFYFLQMQAMLDDINNLKNTILENLGCTDYNVIADEDGNIVSISMTIPDADGNLVTSVIQYAEDGETPIEKIETIPREGQEPEVRTTTYEPDGSSTTTCNCDDAIPPTGEQDTDSDLSEDIQNPDPTDTDVNEFLSEDGGIITGEIEDNYENNEFVEDDEPIATTATTDDPPLNEVKTIETDSFVEEEGDPKIETVGADADDNVISEEAETPDEFCQMQNLETPARECTTGEDLLEIEPYKVLTVDFSVQNDDAATEAPFNQPVKDEIITQEYDLLKQVVGADCDKKSIVQNLPTDRDNQDKTDATRLPEAQIQVYPVEQENIGNISAILKQQYDSGDTEGLRNTIVAVCGKEKAREKYDNYIAHKQEEEFLQGFVDEAANIQTGHMDGISVAYPPIEDSGRQKHGHLREQAKNVTLNAADFKTPFGRDELTSDLNDAIKEPGINPETVAQEQEAANAREDEQNHIRNMFRKNAGKSASQDNNEDKCSLEVGNIFRAEAHYDDKDDVQRFNQDKSASITIGAAQSVSPSYGGGSGQADFIRLGEIKEGLANRRSKDQEHRQKQQRVKKVEEKEKEQEKQDPILFDTCLNSKLDFMSQTTMA